MRNWILVCLCACSLFAADVKPEIVRTLVEIPDDAEHFLQVPASFDMDSTGAYYIVDWLARVMFKWQPDGEFEKIIGAPGGGPGEFGFLGQGGPQGYLGIVDDTLYVYDGGRRAVQVFDKSGKFKESKNLQLQTGRTNSFFIAGPDTWIIDHSSFMKEVPSLTVSIYNSKTEKENIVVDRVDSSFERKSDGGNVTGVVIQGYSEQLVSGYNSLNGQVMVGYSGEPSFNVYDTKGKLLKKVPVKRIRREVKDDDKKEFNEQGWIKNNRFFTTSFPERMPYYDAILPVGESHFLVYEISPFFRRVQGILIDDKGETKGSFRFNCGENGGLLGGKGRVLRVRTDDEGLFQLEELKFKEAS